MANILQIYGILEYIFLNENYNISFQISVKYVPKGPVDN